MPIGVGSVGDIISICLLAKDLVEALNNIRGAAAEYQEIIRELWGLERALLQVDLLSRTHNTSPELNALDATVRQTAENCRTCIASFLEKIKKYEPSLRENGSTSALLAASRKIQWQVMQSSDVSKFRAEIVAHSQSISMLLAILNLQVLCILHPRYHFADVVLNRNSMQINEKKLQARLADSHGKMDASIQQQMNLVAEVRDRLNENNTLISAVATKVTDALRLEWFRQLGSELKAMMNRILRTNMETHKRVLAMERVLPSYLERTMVREPFILEDAVGRISPVHMDFINSWEAFDTILRLRFQDVQGFKKVQKNEYVLQEHATKRVIKRTHRWDVAFMPGQRIEMSLVFKNAEMDGEAPLTSCPSCQAISTKSSDSEVQCNNCGLCYHRIIEYVDVNQPPTTSLCASFESQLRSELSMKRKLDATESEDDIAQFKRVRLIEQIDFKIVRQQTINAHQKLENMYKRLLELRDRLEFFLSLSPTPKM